MTNMNMMRTMLVGVCFVGSVWGQGQIPQPLPNFCVDGSNQKVRNMACVVPNLFYDPAINLAGTVDSTPNARGITLLGAGAAGHDHHFADFLNYSQNLLSLNVAIATQLTSLPIPSPASGFIFTYDRTAGVHVPNPRTLGSILTERAETIGARRVFFGAAYQRFRFGQLDDRDLNGLPGVFSHDTGPAFGVAKDDFITTKTNLDLKIDQVVLYGTVGLTNRLDVSLAVPINNVRFNASANAVINRVPDPVTGSVNLCVAGTSPCHFFAGGVNDLTKSFFGAQTASGVGDITLRIKHSLIHPKPGNQGLSVALLTDVRFPSGDSLNFLGSGAYGVKPFVAVSLGSTMFAPHVNVGYQVNGSSQLAGDVTLNKVGHLPNQFFYSMGTDVGLVKDRLTLAVDYLGQYLSNGPRITDQPFSGIGGAVVPRVGLKYEGYSMSNGSVGAKYAITKHLLFTGNLLFSIDSAGLRQRVTPLIGLSYGL